MFLAKPSLVAFDPSSQECQTQSDIPEGLGLGIAAVMAVASAILTLRLRRVRVQVKKKRRMVVVVFDNAKQRVFFSSTRLFVWPSFAVFFFRQES